MLNNRDIEKSLILLGKRLEIEGNEIFNIVVCGGSALIITGLITGRMFTKDVDLVGLGYKDLTGKLQVRECRELPKTLEKAVRQVARDLGLEDNWLNTDPTSLVRFGLPDGFTERLQLKTYGKLLNVYFTGRTDQIFFKLYAAVDQGPGKHVDDLRELSPADEEIESAAKWAMKHDVSENFRNILKDMLRKLGYDQVAERI